MAMLTPLLIRRIPYQEFSMLLISQSRFFKGILVMLLMSAATMLPAADPAPLKVLFIGNSHTMVNDVPGLFARLARQSGIQVEKRMIAEGGKTLEYHAGTDVVKENILHGDYDWIVLQHWAHPFNETYAKSMENGAQQLFEMIGKTKSKAVFYKPWPRKSTAPGEYPLMSATYARLAKQYNAELANVGDVFEEYRALYPGETMYANDGEHASPLTSNIAAYVILRTITGKKPVCVSAEEKKIEAAWDALLSGTKSNGQSPR
jgi:hypothetical protein